MGCVTCKQCGDWLDIDKRVPEYDEGLDAYFCDCECWVSWYQAEYDRLIAEKEKWKRDCLILQAVHDELKKDLIADKADLINARAEIVAIHDCVIQAMKAIGAK